jgi:ribonuclease Z
VIKAENKSHISEDICFFASVDNHPWSYLFDCGKARYLSAGDCKSLHAIFVTHTHIDHFCNFDTLLRHHVGMRRVVTICGPKGIAMNVQGKARSYTWNLIKKYRPVYRIHEIQKQKVTVYELGPPHWDLIEKSSFTMHEQICFKEKGLFVRCAELDHKIPSMAYAMEEDSSLNISDFPHRPGPWIKQLKDAYQNNQPDQSITVDEQTVLPAKELFQYLYVKQGWKLGYAMDHLACKENHTILGDLFRNANEVVIEGFFRECDKDYALKHYHSTAYESGKLARQAGAEKLTLVHHSRRYQRELKDLREEAYAVFEGREPKFESDPVARYTQDEGGETDD